MTKYLPLGSLIINLDLELAVNLAFENLCDKWATSI